MSTWNIDTVHSSIEFKIKHLMVSTVKGHFGEFTGTLTSTDDTFEDASISFDANATGITTGNTQRDGHLQSPDFFNTEQFPKVTFTSTSFTKKAENKFSIVGKLTMKGVAKEVTLEAMFGGFAKAQDGKRVAAFDVSGTINRADFGITWNTALDTGGVALSNEVWLDATIELKEV